MIAAVDVVLLTARLLLAGVFVVAGVAKLVDRAGSRQAVADFGVPARLAAPVALVLPLAELAVAVALLPAASAWWGAVGALVLLLSFATAIAISLARGRKPDCHCFGQLHSAPAGWRTLARNALLAGAAVFVVSQPDRSPSAVGWLADLTSAERVAVIGGLVALVFLAAEGWLLLNLFRQNGRVLVRLDALEARLDAAGIAGASSDVDLPETGLPIGAPAPGFSLSGLHGEVLTLDALRVAGKPVMLIFSDPDCGPCTALLPEIGGWQRDQSARIMFAVVSRGTPDANRAKSAEHGLFNVLLQEDREVAEAYEVEGTPAAVVVDSEGTIASRVAAGADAMRALVARIAGSEALRPGGAQIAPSSEAIVRESGNGAAPVEAGTGPAIGDPVPKLTLPDLEGKRINLARRRRDTLILFWDPHCGFCEQMLDDLKDWEANSPADAPDLLVVSTGTVEENRGMGLRSPIVLDSGFTAGHAFGATGTPSAVVVDGKSRIASRLAVGAAQVLELAGLREGPAQEVERASATRGEPAPPVTLPDLSGNTLDFADFRGTRTLVLFWNPQCGFCRRMLDDLKAWEADPPEGAAKLVVISTGTVDENHAMGIRSPVLLDQEFAAGRAFGADGTPMAVLVDADGTIASEPIAGADRILALASGEAAAAERGAP